MSFYANKLNVQITTIIAAIIKNDKKELSQSINKSHLYCIIIGVHDELSHRFVAAATLLPIMSQEAGRDFYAYERDGYAFI